MDPVERRRASLREESKDSLVEIVLRLQEQVRDLRQTALHALEDGVNEGKRRAAAQEKIDSETRSRPISAVRDLR